MALRTLSIALVDFGLVAAADCRVHIAQLRAGKDSGSIVIPTVRLEGRTNNAGLLTVQLLPNDNHSRYHVKIYNSAGSVATKGYFDMPDSNASLADIIVFEDAFTGTAATAELIKKLTMRGDWDVTAGDGLPAAVRNDAVRLVNVPSVGAPVVEGRTVVNGQTVYFDASGTWRSLSHRLITGLWDMTGAAVDCTYALNSDDNAAIDLGFAGAVNMTGQVGTLTIVGGLGAELGRLSLSAAGQIVNTATGKKVFETVFTVSQMLISGGMSGGTGLIDAGTFAQIVGTGIQVNATDIDLYVTIGGSSVVTVPGVLGENHIGVELDSATSTLRAIINGVEATLLSNTYTEGNALLGMTTYEGVGCAIGDVGKTLGVELRTALTSFAQTYAVDAESVCGAGGGVSEATLPEGAQPEDVYEVSVAGTYNGVDFGIGDLAMVRSDGVSVTRIGPGRNGTNGSPGATGAPGAAGTPGANGTDGNDGWSPVFTIATDGARRVLQVSDWTGGEGTKPAVGKYVGAAGLVDLIADGVDVRGATGPDGADATGFTYIWQTNDASLSTFTPIDTDITFSMAASKNYEVEVFAIYTSTVATLGVGFKFVSDQGADTDIHGFGVAIAGTSGTLASIGAQSDSSLPTGTLTLTSVASNTAKQTAFAKYLIKSNLAANIKLQFFGENTGATYTLYGNNHTFIKLREIP